MEIHPLTVIEIKDMNDKHLESIRDINVPIIGDLISINHLNALFKVKVRHWIIDKNQSERNRELRCVLNCKQVK